MKKSKPCIKFYAILLTENVSNSLDSGLAGNFKKKVTNCYEKIMRSFNVAKF